MANDSTPVTVFDRLNAVESSMKTGDSYAAQHQLDNVSSQQIFMDHLASRAQADSLPGLKIDADTDGHAHQIKTDKLTVSDQGGHLTAHANHWKDAIWSGAGDKWASVVEAVTPGTPEKFSLRDCLQTAGTPESCGTRALDGRMKRAGVD